jgi:5-bromo-4-chloroindolyl phosphate hydrolysis protein
MGMYRHKMPDRELSEEMTKADYWEVQADMWHQNYKEAANEIVKLRQVLQQITELSPFKSNTGYASLQYVTQRLVEMTALAHEALKEKE